MKNFTDEGFVIVDGKLIDYKGQSDEVIIPDCVKVVGTHSLGENVRRVSFPASVEKIEPVAFFGAYRLEEIKVDAGNPFYYSDGDCLIERATKKIIKGTRFSEIPQDGSVTAIGEYAFVDVESSRLCICDRITVIESHAFGCNDDVTLLIEAKSKPEGWADDWDNGEGELWSEVWWESGPRFVLEWGADFSE